MKLNLFKLFLMLGAFTFSLSGIAQKPKTTAVTKTNYPASFTITKTEFNNLVALNEKQTLRSKSNKYLNKAVVLKKVSNGDMTFQRVKLSYFNKSFLTIQINGTDSKQVFILSEDKSVFYKGTPEKDGFIMTKCEEDEIVSE